MHRTSALAALLFCGAITHGQWAQMPSTTAQDLYAVHFPDATTGYAVGAGSTILTTTDQGLTWSGIAAPLAGDLLGVWFLNAAEGFVVGDSGIFHTVNSGTDWTQVSTPVALPWRTIRFIDPLIGFCGGGIFGNGSLLRTVDGGDTWEVVLSGEASPISAIDFPTPDIGYVVEQGYTWSVRKSINGGTDWGTIAIQPMVSTSIMEAIHFTSATTGYLGGVYIPAFLRTDDGAASWIDLAGGQNTHMLDLAFHSAAHGLAVGQFGLIQHLHNGTDWQDESWPDPNVVCHAAQLPTDTVAVVVGSGGTVLRWSSNSTGMAGITRPGNRITLHPSPATEYASLVCTAPLPERTRLELYDAQGRSVVDVSVRSGARIGIADLRPGTYSWRCVAPSGLLERGRLVKQ